MATKKKTEKSMSGSQKAGIGIGLTAAAVAAAGAYFLTGSKDAAKNRRKVKSWMFKAKAEVLEGLENAQEMTEAEFNQLVATVGTTYGKLKDASQADIKEFKSEMLEHWPKIVKEGKQVAKTVSKVVKKAPAKKKAATKKKTPAKKTVAKKAPVKKAVKK